jgi:hypothetical protein
MGKRGPAPRGEYTDKSQVLSTRIRADTRAALVHAAKRSGRSLSQEIEKRLRRTFTEDERIHEGFGTARNRALMKMIASVMQTAWHPDRPDAEWLDDPWLFDQTIRLINLVLFAVRPPGPSKPPANQKLRRKLRHIEPMARAADIWHFVQNANASLPLKADSIDHHFNRLKADLGDIAQRPIITQAATTGEVVRKTREAEKALWAQRQSKRARRTKGLD